MKHKSFFFLLSVLLLAACAQESKNKIVGKWKYERIVVNAKTGADTMGVGIGEMVYEGTVLAFYQNDSFAMINQDTASDFQGTGTYEFNDVENTLTLQGGVKMSAEERMKVKVKELTEDSLKLGNTNEQMIYSRVKE